jgi:hypothetical protein
MLFAEVLFDLKGRINALRRYIVRSRVVKPERAVVTVEDHGINLQADLSAAIQDTRLLHLIPRRQKIPQRINPMKLGCVSKVGGVRMDISGDPESSHQVRLLA